MIYTKPEKLDILQVLRGLSAFLILIGHTLFEVSGIYSSFEKPNIPTWLGVDIFFVISGFVMVYTCQNHFAQAGALKDFLVRRIIRIVPVYWFFTALLLILAFFVPSILENGRGPDVWHVVSSFFFIAHENPNGGIQPLLRPGWTLNYEMFFYLCFGLCLLLPRMIGLIALTLLFALLILIAPMLPADAEILKFYTQPIIAEFILGIWCGYAFIRGARIAFIPALLLSALIAVAGGYYIVEQELYSQRNLIFNSWLILSVLPLFFTTRSMPDWLVALGDSSYTLYLSHAFIIGGITLFVAKTPLIAILPPWSVILVCILTSIVLAHLFYVLAERPVHIFLKNKYKNRKQAN